VKTVISNLLIVTVLIVSFVSPAAAAPAKHDAAAQGGKCPECIVRVATERNNDPRSSLTAPTFRRTRHECPGCHGRLYNFLTSLRWKHTCDRCVDQDACRVCRSR
jgi:hypothetical protein